MRKARDVGQKAADADVSPLTQASDPHLHGPRQSSRQAPPFLANRQLAHLERHGSHGRRRRQVRRRGRAAAREHVRDVLNPERMAAMEHTDVTTGTVRVTVSRAGLRVSLSEGDDHIGLSPDAARAIAALVTDKLGAHTNDADRVVPKVSTPMVSPRRTSR
jgi:hypothetical protein